jgi:hypothetical protein
VPTSLRAPFFIALGIYAGGRYADKKKSPPFSLSAGTGVCTVKNIFSKTLRASKHRFTISKDNNIYTKEVLVYADFYPQ